jgi:hypothetical protein
MKKKFLFVDDLIHGRARPRGIFRLKVLRSGVVVRKIEDHNLVVNTGLFQTARLLAGDVTGRSITKIGFGTGGVDPDPADTALTGQYLWPVTGHEYPADDQVRINWILPATECNGMHIQEFGLFTADNTMFSRFTIKEAIPKQSLFSLEGSWFIQL